MFQGSCNTEVVDTYFEKVLLPALPLPALNPIELVWASFKTRLPKNLPPPPTTAF